MSSGSNDKPKPGDKSPADADTRGEDRVIRDADGVIVGARASGPRILGVIDLKGVRKSEPRKPQSGESGQAAVKAKRTNIGDRR